MWNQSESAVGINREQELLLTSDRARLPSWDFENQPQQIAGLFAIAGAFLTTRMNLQTIADDWPDQEKSIPSSPSTNIEKTTEFVESGIHVNKVE